MFDLSLQSSKIPEEWKIREISAIFKKGNRRSPMNYKPVSLTSIVCKLLESLSLVREEIISHMRSNKLLSPYQYGFFIDKRSTTLQLLYGLVRWTEIIDDGGGIKSFLTGRKQRVRVGEDSSKRTQVTSGIPQGSVLGLLYLSCTSTTSLTPFKTTQQQLCSPMIQNSLPERMHSKIKNNYKKTWIVFVNGHHSGFSNPIRISAKYCPLDISWTNPRQLSTWSQIQKMDLQTKSSLKPQHVRRILLSTWTITSVSRTTYVPK